MSDVHKANERQKVMTMWVVWFAIFAGLFIMVFVTAPEVAFITEPDSKKVMSLHNPAYSPLTIVGVIAALAGVVVRLFVIPCFGDVETKLRAMIVGLALCESCGIIGLYATQSELLEQRMVLFWTSVVTVLVSAPIYLHQSKNSSPFHQS